MSPDSRSRFVTASSRSSRGMDGGSIMPRDAEMVGFYGFLEGQPSKSNRNSLRAVRYYGSDAVRSPLHVLRNPGAAFFGM